MNLKNTEIGQWKKGQSGNPAGRKKGIISSPVSIRKACQADFTKIAHEKLEGWKEKLVDKLFERSCQEGDIPALIYLWNLFYDKKIPHDIISDLKTKTAADIDHAQSIIFKEMASGEMDMDHGMLLIKGLAIKRDSSVVKDLEEKVNTVMEGGEE